MICSAPDELDHADVGSFSIRAMRASCRAPADGSGAGARCAGALASSKRPPRGHSARCGEGAGRNPPARATAGSYSPDTCIVTPVLRPDYSSWQRIASLAVLVVSSARRDPARITFFTDAARAPECEFVSGCLSASALDAMRSPRLVSVI